MHGKTKHKMWWSGVGPVLISWVNAENVQTHSLQGNWRILRVLGFDIIIILPLINQTLICPTTSFRSPVKLTFWIIRRFLAGSGSYDALYSASDHTTLCTRPRIIRRFFLGLGSYDALYSAADHTTLSFLCVAMYSEPHKSWPPFSEAGGFLRCQVGNALRPPPLACRENMAALISRQARGTESVANRTAKKSPSLPKKGSRLMRFTVHKGRGTIKLPVILSNLGR